MVISLPLIATDELLHETELPFNVISTASDTSVSVSLSLMVIRLSGMTASVVFSCTELFDFAHPAADTKISAAARMQGKNLLKFIRMIITSLVYFFYKTIVKR